MSQGNILSINLSGHAFKFTINGYLIISLHDKIRAISLEVIGK